MRSSESSFWRTGFLFAFLALAMPYPLPPDPPDPLIDIHGLAPRQLKSVAFALTSEQDLRIAAVGAESEYEHGTMTMLKAMWDGKKSQLPWSGNAWIIDLKSRKVVWELSAAKTSAGSSGTRTFDGSVKLPAGSYQAFYASYPSAMYWTEEEGKRSLIERLWNGSGHDTVDAFRLVIDGNARLLTGNDLAKVNDEAASGSIVRFHALAGEQLQQTGFSLDRPTAIEVYAIGEARQREEFDFGWIVNADTHEKVWKLTWDGSDPAGGAEKNRMARFTRTLPAGRYAAFYATDDSHDPSAWNAPPPHDPDAWGLQIRVEDAGARAAAKTFAYDNVPDAATFVALTGVGDGQVKSRGFTLAKPMDVRVYAIGEGRDGRMFDYGWITSGAAHQRVWEMRYDDTESAGGDSKNRLVDRVVHLDRGSYTVYYVTDDSHSAEKWNAAAPSDGRRWGITLLDPHGTLNRTIVSTHAESPDPSVIAQLVGLRDNQQPRTRFTLSHESDVRIYALGEGVGNEMVDYGWIEDGKSGRRVWEMTYRSTDHAGGALKNRRFDGTITLPRGEYILRYETDGSHAFGDWNANPPDDPVSWGITVSRVTLER